MATWPSSLPQSMRVDTYSEQLQDQTVRSETDAGPPKQRRRFTAAYTNISGEMVMSSSQVSTFENFWDVDTQGGALSFSMPHPRTGTTVTARFKRPYTLEYAGGDYYIVRMELEILP